MALQAPLHGLDEVPWAELTHAYGSAADVPELLRELASDTVLNATDGDALFELYGNIFHQGSRYQATPHAVPFIAEIALNSDCANQVNAIELLICLALGYEENWLPLGINIQAYRESVAEWTSQISEEERIGYAQYGHGPDPELASYEAVNACIPDFIDLLHQNPTHPRAEHIVRLLAWFPDHADMAIAVIRRTLASVDAGDSDSEQDDVVATCLVASGLLLQSSSVVDPDILGTHWFGHGALVVRVAAAIALSIQYSMEAIGETEQAVLKTLLSLLPHYREYEQDRMAGFQGGDLVQVCLNCINRFPPENTVKHAVAAMREVHEAKADTYRFSDVLVQATREGNMFSSETPLADYPSWAIEGLQAILTYGNWSHPFHQYAMESGRLPITVEAFAEWLASAIPEN